VRPFDWRDGPLGALQPLPRDGEPVATRAGGIDAAWVEVTRGVRDVVKGVRGRPASPLPPEQFREAAELDAAWRAGWCDANQAWEDQVEKIVSRQREFLHRLKQKKNRDELIQLYIAVPFSLGLVALLGWADAPWTLLLTFGGITVVGVVDVVRKRRIAFRLGGGEGTSNRASKAAGSRQP
jgi:hypothetical protein